MRNKPETVHEYNIPRLNWWFLISSALFVVCFALMIWVDYSGGEISWLGLRGDRRWKEYQRDFYDLERQRLAADARSAELRAQEAGLGNVQQQLEQANQELAAKHDQLAAAEAAAARAKVEADRIMREFTMAKASRDEFRSFYEAALERNEFDREADEVGEWLRKVKTQTDLVSELALEKERIDADHTTTRAAVEALVGQRAELERTQKRLNAARGLLQARLDELDSFLIQTVVNAPVMEFVAPTYKVEQIIAENHHVDVNFTTVPRVDRCITCHKGIDRKPLPADEVSFREENKIDTIDWDHLPQPLTGHPRLDLYVSDTSPHPASKFGCTVCHWGWDRETDFSRAGHTPNHEEERAYRFDDRLERFVELTEDELEELEELEEEALEGERPREPQIQPVRMTQRDAWEENYDWFHEHYNLQPIRESKYTEASCLKCHVDETRIDGADQLNNGRRLVEQLGCWSCHKMKQAETFTTHLVRQGETFDELCRVYDINPDEVRRINNLPQKVALTPGWELSLPMRALRKVGPSLYQVAGKTDPDWMRKWLYDPVAFRPNTYMPRFWDLSNSNDPARDDVEISAVTEFLFTVSDDPAYPAPPVAGDAARGEELVRQVGCLGCHVIDEKLADLKPPAKLRRFMGKWEYRRLRSQGPQLAGAGSKSDVNWLFAWLKDPKQYHPGTKMPDLRLADQEAADIASYLVKLHNESTDQKKLPTVESQKLDELTLEYLQVTLSAAEAEKKLGDLNDLVEPYFVEAEIGKYYRDPKLLVLQQRRLEALKTEYEETFDDAIQKQADELEAELQVVAAKRAAAKKRVSDLSDLDKKNVYLGSKLIARYGCFACHDIRGFESAKPIGTELSEWGSKAVNKLDFGLLEIEHDRVSWLKQKLHAPRLFDKGRVGVTRTPQEHLKMPKFNITEEQIDQVVTVVSGLTDEKLRASEARQLTPAEFHIERGRWMTKELNCNGCHQIEGRGWAIRASGIPNGMEPPMISGLPGQLRQGQRTRHEWLFRFLKTPVTGEVRPWLKARMPTFGLTDAEANVLVRYFALEGRAKYPHETPEFNDDPVHLAAGKQLFEQLKCALCHIVEGKALGKPLSEIPEEDLPRLAPNLSLSYDRLQRGWLIEKWLPEPLALVPGTRMPQFEYGVAIAPDILDGDGERQKAALVDYILSLGVPGGGASAAETEAEAGADTASQ